MAVQHSCDLLHALPERWKDHHTGAYFLRTWIWTLMREKRHSMRRLHYAALTNSVPVCYVILSKLNMLCVNTLSSNIIGFKKHRLWHHTLHYCIFNVSLATRFNSFNKRLSAFSLLYVEHDYYISAWTQNNHCTYESHISCTAIISKSPVLSAELSAHSLKCCSTTSSSFSSLGWLYTNGSSGPISINHKWC